MHAAPVQFRCPVCRVTRCQVLDSRERGDRSCVTRRRACANGHRFTTIERVCEEPPRRGPKKKPRAACKYPGCDKIAESKGLCNAHYQRAYRLLKAGSAMMLKQQEQQCQKTSSSPRG